MMVIRVTLSPLISGLDEPTADARIINSDGTTDEQDSKNIMIPPFLVTNKS